MTLHPLFEPFDDFEPGLSIVEEPSTNTGGFLNPQGCENDDCCNGEPHKCCCTASMDPCLISWDCPSPRDSKNLPCHVPHKIRLKRAFDGDPWTVFHETELASGSYVPILSGVFSSRYQIEMCCDDPGTGTCNWKILGSMNVTNSDPDCPPCIVLNHPCGYYVRNEGELPVPAIIIVEIDSTLGDCCGSTTDWSGLYVLSVEDMIPPNTCVTESVFVGNFRTCGIQTFTDFLSIRWFYGPSFILTNRVEISISSATGANICRSAASWVYLNPDVNHIFSPKYSNCPGFDLRQWELHTEFGLDSSSISNEVGTCLSNCEYPPGYNPIVSIVRQ